MILFLSSAFLRRFRMQWKPGLKAFLVGDRNLFFFYPDLLLETSEINPESIESFLGAHGKERIQLLGFVTPEKITPLPGYIELDTHNVFDPQKWDAQVHLLQEQGLESRKLEIKASQE